AWKPARICFADMDGPYLLRLRELRDGFFPDAERAASCPERISRASRFALARRSLAVVPRKAAGLADAARFCRGADSSRPAACRDLKLVSYTSRKSMRRASRSTLATCT